MNLVNIFSDELMHALGWSLIHSLWQGAAIALLLAIVLLLFRKKSSKFRYRLSVSSLFFAFALFVGTFMIFYLNTASIETENILIQNEEIIEVIIESTNPITEENTNFLTVYTNYFNTHLPFIVTLWLMGMVIFTLRFLGGLAYSQRLKHSQHSPMDFEWEEVMNEIQTQFNITQNIQLVESKLVAVPMVIGYLKPMILFPFGVINQLSISEVEAVLAHELAHIKRYDYLVNIVQSIIETLLFFHPAIWWISGEIRRERENCCDDLALEIVDNLTFAKALAILEQFRLNSIYQRKPQFSMAAITNKNQLLNRVQRILNQPQKNQNNFRGFFAACILLISFVATSLDAQQVEAIEPKNKSEFPTILTEVDVIESKNIVSEEEEFSTIIESDFSTELVEFSTSTLLESDVELLDFTDAKVTVHSNSSNFNWTSPDNMIIIPKEIGLNNQTIVTVKTDNVVSITIKKDTSITGIEEITIIRNVKDKNGNDAKLKMEIKSVDGIKTVTTYENGKKLDEKDQKYYQSYIDESQAIANKESVHFGNNGHSEIRLRKKVIEKEVIRRQAEAEGKRADKLELAEVSVVKKEMLEQKRELAVIARERAIIERELAEHNKNIAREYQEQLKELQAQEREIIAGLAEQQTEVKRQMAEQALVIAKSQKHNIWINQFKIEMVKDGILKEEPTNFKLKMDDKGIKVNGKKLTLEQEKKYIKIYESITGEKWQKGNAIHIQVTDEKF